jgi:hypothetical protein
MLFDGKRASSLTTNRQLSDPQWAKIQEHLGLPDHARDDFEKIVAKHLKATEWRERIKAWPTEDLDAAEQLWSDALARKGVVMARNRGVQNVMPQDDLRGWTNARALSPRTLRRWMFGPKVAERLFVFAVADCVERYTGERPNHGARWLSKLIAAIAIVDREIGAGTIQGALRPPRHGVPKTP